MAYRVDLPKELLQDAINLKIASTKRANNNEKNTIIKEAREKEVAALTTGLNTITETK